MDRYLQCLSPVHIGTGNTLEPFDYISDGDRYIRPDMNAVLQKMTNEQIDALTAWVSERADRIADSPDNRQRSEIRREMNLLRFAQNDTDLRRALLEDDQLAQYRGRAGFEKNREIRELIKGAGCDPLVPGSSIKGAMRTALAYLALKEMTPDERREVLDGERNSDIRGLRTLVNQRRGLRDDRIGQDLEKLIFRCGEQQRDGSISYNNIHGDLMRVISVSDTFNPQAELIVPQVYTFVEKRNPRRSNEVEFQAQAPLITEAHAPGNRFQIRLQIDAALLQGIARQQRRGHWIKFRERVARTFGKEVEQLLDNGSEVELKEAVVGRIETACRTFASVVAAREWKWAEKRQEASRLKDFYQKLESLDKGLVPLRLGWGSHFMSTTLMMALLEDDGRRSVLEDFIRVFEIDVPGGSRARNDRNIDLDAFPKSRRLVAIEKRPAAPFGWIVLGSDEQSLPGGLVEVDEILSAPRREEQGRSSHDDRGRGRQGTGQFRGRPREEQADQYGSTRQESDSALAAQLKQAKKAVQQKQGETKGPRRGERVAAEVVSNDGQRVTVRLQTGEEVVVKRAYFPPKAGQKIKVKVDAVNAEGKVTKVNL